MPSTEERTFNSRPHAEVDRAFVILWQIINPFQFTTSRRGRLHPPDLFHAVVIFQFTTSRRGRQCRSAECIRRKPFNSRPHAEVDLFLAAEEMIGRATFNSRPHAEVDYRSSLFLFCLPSFNSRPHAEVDDRDSLTCSPQSSFNSRPHAEVDDRKSLR